jgi:hypothetical protein
MARQIERGAGDDHGGPMVSAHGVEGNADLF